MDYNYLRLEKEDKLAILVIERPKALNALNRDLLLELKKALSSLENDNKVRALVITGAGSKAFVAGADIAAMKDMTYQEADDFSRLGQGVFNMIEESRLPVIAAVNGYALGGGNELALACDLRIAGENARFGQPEVSLGIIAGFGGTQRLAKIVGEGWAKELLLTGEMIDAGKALEIGLVNRVVAPDRLVEEAKELATKIASQAPIAVEQTKKAVNLSLDVGLERGLNYERTAFANTFYTRDQRIGMEAFLKKEKVEFKGE